ncbi:MAG: VCBS repeat-containing protein [Deltaproteobacteria bacterium]|nr:VCBS repeat-containing protein [Deltaproteobacteria bacterium]
MVCALCNIQYRRINGVVIAVALLLSASAARAASRPVALAAAPPAASTGLPPVPDLNGDGIPDLVVVNSDSSRISLFFGTGTGLPSTPSATLTGTPTNPLSTPRGVALGDFNGDGVTDIAVTNFRGATVSVFLGHKSMITNLGDGTFAPPTNLPVIARPLGVAVGRFRGPGQPLDLAVVNNLNGRRTRIGRVSILLGNGDGTFELPASNVTVGLGPRNLVVGDFGTSATDNTRDGKLDIAVSLFKEASVGLLFGDGTGFFTPLGDLNDRTGKYFASTGPDAIVLGDFNFDGCDDIFTANSRLGENNLILNLGFCNPPASFGSLLGASEEANLQRGSHPAGMTPVDLNGDGKLDLAVTTAGRNGPNKNKLVYLVNQGHPGPMFSFVTFAQLSCPAGGTAPVAAVAAQLNPSVDSVDDLAVANRGNNTVSLFLGDGSGTTCPTPIVIQP